jgi:hypothetical protein
MPVYLAFLQNSTCRSEGCLCHDRVRSYLSDLTDDEWAVLEPQVREVMRELVRAQGRPMGHGLRAMSDAFAYVVRNGIEWRAVPVDFPPWDSVYAGRCPAAPTARPAPTCRPAAGLRELQPLRGPRLPGSRCRKTEATSRSSASLVPGSSRPKLYTTCTRDRFAAPGGRQAAGIGGGGEVDVPVTEEGRLEEVDAGEFGPGDGG